LLSILVKLQVFALVIKFSHFKDAGYEVVLIETVGVGQSEIEVKNVVDFVIYVIPPGSGDGL
jgi:putative protein kinase ArgK-like GTPase of G3E family